MENTVSIVIAGAFSGLVMASVFVAVGPIMVFSIAKDPPQKFQVVLDRFPPLMIMMGLVAVSYPAWTLVGAFLGLLYWVSLALEPVSGLGSPNLAFTVAMVAVGLALAAAALLVIRRVAIWIAALAALFMVDFGWFLPLLAG